MSLRRPSSTVGSSRLSLLSADLNDGSLSDSELLAPISPSLNLREAWDNEFSDDVDPSVAFFYKPRSVRLLILMLAGLVYLAMFVANTDDVVFNVKVGIGAAAVVFCLIGMIQFRDGPFVRPHPAFWRIVLSTSVVYQILLVFVLFQNKHTMREKFLPYLDPTVGVPLPERSYADACTLTPQTIWDQMDVFVVAHAVGWYAKAIVLRDYWFCWILSVMFEIMEYSLAHQLPNFAECWWDHWILDVLMANWAGIILGMKTCQYFAMKQYTWRGITEIPTYRGKVKRTMQQFTPHSWTDFKWEGTKTFKNFVAVIGLLYLVLQSELNAFYLKYLLWLPPSHYINVWRLIYYFFMALPAVREAFQYMTDRRCKRLGMHAWMATANILTELLIVIKFGQGEFPEPMPWEVKVGWAAFGAMLGGYALVRFGLKDNFAGSKLSGASSDSPDRKVRPIVERVPKSRPGKSAKSIGKRRSS
ncbi:phosphatidyl serine synthase-domain-containing protein [Powellomyces hirtus]|nr:phosphatidyl serine synthase-domain-containing protein [Powellomyces hirtus]